MIKNNIIESDNYWIYNNIFIFKYFFNGNICSYIEIIKNQKILIFSNFDNLDKVIKNFKEKKL